MPYYILWLNKTSIIKQIIIIIINKYWIIIRTLNKYFFQYQLRCLKRVLFLFPGQCWWTFTVAGVGKVRAVARTSETSRRRSKGCHEDKRTLCWSGKTSSPKTRACAVLFESGVVLPEAKIIQMFGLHKQKP